MDGMLKRRDALKLGAVGVTGLAVPGGLGAASLRRLRETAAPEAFSVPLALPPRARPVRRTWTTDYYEMTVREAQAEILPGVQTKIMGYDGRFLGPVVHALKDRRVVIRQTNALDMETNVHLHGGHTPVSNDGYPSDLIEPGASRDYVYANDQPATTLWYHDHTHHMSADMIFRGLSGTYIITDPAELRLGLPAGRHDVPIILRDIRFDDAGQIVFEMDDFQYRNTVLVNGRPQPYFEVSARKYRLRLLNTSNLRFFSLGLSTGTEMTVVASDGGLLPAPRPVKNIMLSPGERADVVVDFGAHDPGTRIVLVNEFGTDDATRNVMRFDVGRRVWDPSRIPESPVSAPDLGEAQVTRDVHFGFDPQKGGWLIDGKTFDMDRVDMRIRRGDTEIWRVHNTGAGPSVPHNMHLHGTSFEVLDRDGQAVAAHETGLKDTVYVGHGSTVRIKVRYDRYLGRYLYHCHLLDHSSMGMMAQAEIV